MAEEQNMSATGSDMVSMLRRIRVLEERYSNLRKKSLVIEQNQILHKKNISNELKSVEMEMISIKREFIDINDKLSLVNKELSALASSSEVRYLTKYLEFFNPVNFVTVKEMERRINNLDE